MKTLKLDHNLAEAIRRGEKHSTWRMYDDKDIHVNDIIELIDKVDPQNPGTWVSAGNVLIKQVTEKRLGDVSGDLEGYAAYASPDDMLHDFQKYYGPQVTFDTPVKIIMFTPQAEGPAQYLSAVSDMPLQEINLYADGGSRGNPGPSASGFALFTLEGEEIGRKGLYIGVTTNNQAEYQALKLGLEEAKLLGIREVHVYMDSLLVVNQMLGKFKVKNRDLWPIHDSVKTLLRAFARVSFVHIPRELNKIADKAVNDALDLAEQSQI